MKYLSLVSIILSTSLTFTSCEKAEITEDSQNQPTEKQTGKAYKVNVMARSASASAITYPVTIYAKDNEGNVAAQQTINSATDEISLQLTSGSYTITAISGSTDFSSGYSTTPLLIGHSDITVSDASTSVNILLSYAVASLNVTMSNIPSDVTEVSLTISNQYTSVSTDGEYSGSGKCVIPCTKSGSNWTTGTVYVLPGCGSNTVMSFTVTSPSGTETYGLTYSSSLKAATPYTFVGIYDGSTDVSTVKVTGTLACGEWEKEIQSSFSFGPNGTNSFDDAVEVSSYTVSELPAQGSLWNGHVVAYIDGNDALLLSLQEWSDLTSAYYEADPDVAKNIAASYSEGDISSWSIPTSDQARLLRSAWKADNIANLNSVITSANGTQVALTSDGKNVRYLCQAATYTFSFVESSSFTAAGKTVKTYRLRLVKPVTFKVE